VPGSSSLQCPSMISLFVGLKCPTPLGVHSHKVMSWRFLQQSDWSLKVPISQVSWGSNYAVLAAYRYCSQGELKLHQSVVAHKKFHILIIFAHSENWVLWPYIDKCYYQISAWNIFGMGEYFTTYS
jgi:hypothetical protein